MNLLADVRQRFFLPLLERVGRIAIGAAQITRGEPDKNARQSCERAFALQAQVNLIDDECIGHQSSLRGWPEKE